MLFFSKLYHPHQSLNTLVISFLQNIEFPGAPFRVANLEKIPIKSPHENHEKKNAFNSVVGKKQARPEFPVVSGYHCGLRRVRARAAHDHSDLRQLAYEPD